jgi:hypothetical protein
MEFALSGRENRGLELKVLLPRLLMSSIVDIR